MMLRVVMMAAREALQASRRMSWCISERSDFVESEGRRRLPEESSLDSAGLILETLN
jgi:hypothetical protein